MLDNRTMLAKTDLGREAVARRTHNLNPRQRAVLISINGETDVAALSSRFGAGAPETVRSLLEFLLDQGLVEPVNAPGGVPENAVTVKQNSAPEPLPVGEEASVRTMPSLKYGIPEGPGQLPKLSAANIDDWPDVQRRASEKLHEIMGADADLLNMRMANASNERNFLAHLEKAVSLINETRGAMAAEAFWHDLFIRS